MIFVFGSNESGIHGAGAAKYASLNKGAIFGVGHGPAGNSYALPTKDWRIESLSLDTVQHYVNRFIAYAQSKPKAQFQVTRVGCGLAGFKDSDIAPMFNAAPANCLFDTAWAGYISDSNNRGYWGTV